jgi:RHS repeat-associated protein
VKLVQANGVDLPGASVSVATAGAPAGQFKYVALAQPVTLAANTAYFVVSQETSGADSWYDNNTTLTTTTTAGSVSGYAWAYNGTTSYNVSAAPNKTYGPVGFKYQGGWQLTNEVRHLYDGMLVVQEQNFDPQLSTINPQQVVTYTRGLDLSGTLQGAGGIGGLLARSDHSRLNAQPATAFYHSDGNGNVTALLNPAGGLVAQYAYDPYGQLLLARGPLADKNTYRFSSKEWHHHAGLYYFGYRFYDPNLQRWLNPDPISEAGGMNLYGFVHNAPLNSFDPYGLAISPFYGGDPNSPYWYDIPGPAQYLHGDT